MKILRLRISLLLALIGYTSATFAEPLRLNKIDLVQDTFNVALRTNSISDVKQMKIDFLKDGFSAPDDRKFVTIVFKKGMSRQELIDAFSETDIELISMIAKTELLGQVQTFTFNQVQNSGSTLEQVVEYNVARHFQVVNNIKNTIEEDLTVLNLSEEDRAAKKNDFDRYSMLSDLPLSFFKVDIFGSFTNILRFKLENFRQIRAIIPNQNISSEDVERSLDLPTLNTSFSPFENSESTESNGIRSAIATKAIDVVFAGELCGGTGAPERLCPPDPFWLPAGGVEVNVQAQSSGGGSTGMPEIISGNIRQTWSWATDELPDLPGLRLNTISFKADFLPACDPDITLSLTAPCGGSTPEQDVFYVPEPTYEQEGLIENRICTITRTGTAIDRSFGCLLASYSTTNLPASYLDTAFLDSGRNYAATMGTIAPERIIEGSKYETYIEFWANGREDFAGNRVIVNGQVGSEFLVPGTAPFRVFAVDTTKLLEGILTPGQ